MKNRVSMGIVSVLALCSSAIAFADTNAKDILNDLHGTNQMEIHMGQLAQDKGATDDVRNYGKELLSDHGDSDKKVQEAASKLGIALKPAQQGVMDKMKMKSLESKTGNEFDRSFAKEMIDDHKKDISKLQAAQKSD